MAFHVVPMVIDQSLHQLASLVHDSAFGDFWDAKDELERLRNVLSTIKAILLDANEMRPSELTLDWITDLTDAVYNAGDFIDLLSARDLGIEVNKGTLPPKVPKCSPYIPLSRIFKMMVIGVSFAYPSQLRKMSIIRNGLDEITRQKGKHGFLKLQSQVVGTTNYRKSYPLFQRSDIVGREEDRKWMVSQIKVVDVIPIVAMGGMGKTTLAQLVFNDNDIVDHFYRRLWVYVPGKFDPITVIRNVIWSASSNGWADRMYTPRKYLSRLNLRELKRRLRYVFRSEDRSKRVLLVLDDLRIEDSDQWLTFMDLLSECSVGIKIIVTTRSRNVAYVIGATEEHRLCALSAHDSWSLFARKVFTEEGEEEAHPELVNLGMNSLVPKCMGNPLAIELLAGCLRMERDDQSWKRIAETELQVTDQIIDMCFNQLPYNLKACFAFCSVFEKGRLFHRSELIRLWSAEGLLLQSPEQAESVDAVGDKCFDELILRCFFQVPRFDDMCQTYAGRVERVEMHDLLHDLAVCVAGKEMATVNSNSHDVSATVRHIAWEREDLTEKEFPVGLRQANTARTFVFMHHMGSVSKSFLEGLLSNFKLLRVLMLSHSMFEELPDLIGDLQHLKLLALDLNTRLKKLPDSTCNLVNLQTLDTRHCNQLIKLPKNLQKLINLRNLALTFNLRCFPGDALRGWISLERLHIVDCRDLESLSEDFGCLKKLRVLKIARCHELVSLPDSMKSLNNIEELKIQNCWELDLTGWKGLHGLSRLRHLVFVGLPRMLEFPDGIDSAASSLHYLEIGMCEELIRLPQGLQLCTSLLKLELYDCKKLRALPDGLHALKNLRELRVKSCPGLAAELERDEGFNWPFISQIPSVSLDFKPQSASMDDTHNNAGTKNQYTKTDSSLVPKMQSQETELQGDAKGKGKLTYGATPMDELQHVPSSPKETDEEAMLAEFPDELRKSCSSIFYLFSKDCEFEQETLVQLWMGMGVITNEAAGESCFNYLLEKGRISFSGTNFVTGIDRYRPDVKSICADLSLQTGDNSRFYFKWEDGNRYPMSNEIQHVSLMCYDIDVAEVFRKLSNFSELRTLMFLGNYGHRVKEVPNHLFESMKGLRILDLSRTHVRKLPSSLRCLAHLHYLDLSWTPIDQLPETMCFLDELQTLKLRGCSSLRRLPQQLKMLTALRHLDIDVLRQLTVMPYGIGALKDLRTLPGFLVGIKDGCKIGELENLNNLTGSFCVAMLENVDSAAEVTKAALWKKDSIRKLELRWTASQLLKMDNKTCDALDYLKPSFSLEELTVLCYGGLTFPNWIADKKFNKLVSLTLFKCEVVSRLPSVEQLPSLRYLTLVKMNGIVEISRHVSCDAAFPKLEKLTIDEMLSLRRWSWVEANEGDFKCLDELNVNSCPKLQKIDVLPYLLSIKHIEIRECLELESLAEKELPDGLQDLIVECCPKIENKLSEKAGEDWWKIQHVPNKQIGAHDADEDDDTSEDHEDADSVPNGIHEDEDNDETEA